MAKHMAMKRIKVKKPKKIRTHKMRMSVRKPRRIGAVIRGKIY